jgi:hypothetical protein
MNKTKEIGVRLSVTNKDGIVHDFRIIGREGHEALGCWASTRPSPWGSRRFSVGGPACLPQPLLR